MTGRTGVCMTVQAEVIRSGDAERWQTLSGGTPFQKYAFRDNGVGQGRQARGNREEK